MKIKKYPLGLGCEYLMVLRLWQALFVTFPSLVCHSYVCGDNCVPGTGTTQLYAEAS